MKEKKEKLVSREYVMLTCINFFMSINFYTLTLVVPPFTIFKFGMSEWLAGLATGIFVFGVLISRFFSVYLINRFGYKPLLTFSVIVLVVTTVCYFFIITPSMIFIIRIIGGFAYGLISTVDITIVTYIVPKNRTGEGMGYYSMGQVLATAVGPSIGLLLLNSANGANFTAIFAICTILPAITIFFLPFMRIKQLVPSEKVGIVEGGKLIDKFIERSVISIAAICFIVYISYACISSFMALYAEEIDLIRPSKYFFILIAAAMFFSRPFVAKIFDRRGANIVFYPSLIAFVIGFLLLSQSTNALMLTSSAILFGLGLGGVQAASLAMVMNISRWDRLVVSNSTYYMALDSSNAVGPVIGGIIIGIAGYREMYFAGFILLLICIPLYFLLYGRRASKTEGGIIRHEHLEQ